MHRATIHVHHELDQRARAVTTVIGELDAATAPELAAHLDQLPVQPDIVDCRFVSLIGSAGLEVLLHARRTAPFVVVASWAVERVASVCGLEGELSLVAAAGPPVLHRSRSGVAVHDAGLRYVYVNDALAAINGLPAQAHYGRTARELFDVTEDELTVVLTAVTRTRSPQRLVVKGDVPSVTGSSWHCTYHPVRYRTDDGMVDGVVATVSPWTATSPGGDVPVARLEFGLRVGG